MARNCLKEIYVAIAIGGERVIDKWEADSVVAAMDKADRGIGKRGYRSITVRGEYTSDGSHWGKGKGRVLATKEYGHNLNRWLREGDECLVLSEDSNMGDSHSKLPIDTVQTESRGEGEAETNVYLTSRGGINFVGNWGSQTYKLNTFIHHQDGLLLDADSYTTLSADEVEHAKDLVRANWDSWAAEHDLPNPFGDVGAASETVILTKSPFRDEWYMKDASGADIARFNTKNDAKAYAKDMGYRMQINDGKKDVEWFGDACALSGPRQSMTYGTLPPPTAIRLAMEEGGDERGYRYSMGRSDSKMAARVGIPSEGTFDANALYAILVKLTDAFNNGDDGAGDFVSGILDTLGFEWI